MAEKPALAGERDKLLIAVGECLNAWSSVELEISNLYMILHGVKRDDYLHPIRISYETVVSLDVRIDMINAYAKAAEDLKDAYYQHINLLSKRIRKLYKKRHEVAHFSIVARHTGELASVKFFIRPFFSWSRFISNEGTELSAEQVSERAANFYQLVHRVQRHVQHIGELRKLPLEHYVQAGDIAFPPLGPEDLN